jgi:hypothetical protein
MIPLLPPDPLPLFATPTLRRSRPRQLSLSVIPTPEEAADVNFRCQRLQYSVQAAIVGNLKAYEVMRTKN